VASAAAVPDLSRTWDALASVDASDSSLAFPELCESARIFWASSAGTTSVRMSVACVMRTSAQTAATPVAPVAGALVVDGALVEGALVDGVVVRAACFVDPPLVDPPLVALVVVELHDAARTETPTSAPARTAPRQDRVRRGDIGGVNELSCMRTLSGSRSPLPSVVER
jgi:hypothetical protein